MEWIETNIVYDLNLVFSDNVIRVISVASPHASPFLKDTMIDKHVLEYHSQQKDKLVPETMPPSLRLPFMSELFLSILPLCREGCILTPPVKLLHEAQRLVDFVGGANPIWSDFAIFLNKPAFIIGISYVPPPEHHVSHEACKFVIDHFLRLHPGEGIYFTRSLIESVLARFDYAISYFKYLDGLYLFEFEAIH